MIGDKSAKAALFQPYFQLVPLAGTIMRTVHLLQDFPGEDIRPIEARQPQFAGGGIEAIMFVLTIGIEDESGGAAFVLETHHDGNLARQSGQPAARQTKRTAAEAAPPAF